MEADFLASQIAGLKAAGVNDPAAERRLRALAYSDNLQLFVVENTAGIKAYVLADSEESARVHAFSAGHIRQESNGICVLANGYHLMGKDAFYSAVQRAKKDRVQGIIIPKGNHALMGSKVYSPLMALK